MNVARSRVGHPWYRVIMTITGILITGCCIYAQSTITNTRIELKKTEWDECALPEGLLMAC